MCIADKSTCNVTNFSPAKTQMVRYPQKMAIDSIIAQIDAEIQRLTQVRSLLAGTGRTAAGLTERKNKRTAAKKVGAKKPRVLSPEARKRIADAQRRRWAAQKSKNK